MSRADDIRAALDKLGPTHTDIAQALTDRRITGIRRSSRVNPLINYLASLGFHRLNLVGDQLVELHYPSSRQVAVCDLPRACADFADNFDAGQYPQLIDERVPR